MPTYTPAYQQSINDEASSAVLPIGPPPGSIMSYLGTTDPPGWVIANGVPRLIGTSNWYSNLMQMNIGNNSKTTPFRYRYIKIEIDKRFGIGYDSLTLGRFIFFKKENSIYRTSSTDNTNIHTVTVVASHSSAPYDTTNDYILENAFSTFEYRANQYSSPTVSGANNKGAVNIPVNSVDNLNISVTIDLGTIENIYGYAVFSSHDLTSSSGDGNNSHPKTWTLWGSNSISTQIGNKVTGWNLMDEVELVQAPTERNQLMLCRHSVSEIQTVTPKPNAILYPNRFASTIYTPPNYNGAFLRGAGTSPHNKYRYDGGIVNIPQRDGIEEHAHYVNYNYYDWANPSGGTKPLVNIGGTGLSQILYSASLPDGTKLGYETRPYNFGVNWIIKL